MELLKKSAKSNGYTGNAVVVGLGRSAIACATHLIDNGWDVEMAEVKSQPGLERNVSSQLPGVAINAPFESDLFVGKDLAVLSCTSAPSNLRIARMAKEYGAEVMNSLELFFHCADKPVISITGTNGKSSVTTLVGNIISRYRGVVQLGGCRGYPFMELLKKRQVDAYLLELSAPHLEQIERIQSDVAAVLNVSPDHLERYKSTDACVGAMAKLISDAKIAVINRDDPIVSDIATSGQRITFGLNSPKSEEDYGVVDFSGVNWVVKAVRTAVTNFEGLPYRCSTEGEWNGVRWVNDARSANVGAALAAIQSNERPVILIAGGLSKGADFSMIPQNVNGRLRGCIFFGRDRREISKTFDVTDNVAKHHVEDIYDAISVANSMTKEGDCVVFSPGCASNDQFTDFEHRGKSFSQALQLQVL